MPKSASYSLYIHCFFPVICLSLATAVLFPKTLPALKPEVSQERRDFRTAEIKRLSAKRQEITPVRSFERIAKYYLSKNNPLKAMEIYMFGLNHQPLNENLLNGLLQTAVSLKKYELARPYALHYLEIAPQSSNAYHYHTTIENALSQQRKSSEQAAKEAFNTPRESSSTSKESDNPQTEAPKSPGEDEKTPKEEEPEPAPQFTIEDELKGLKVLSAIDSAVKIYNLRNKEAPMEELSIEKLKESGILPSGLKLKKFGALLKLSSGEPEITGMGKLSELTQKLAPVKEKIQKVREYVSNGEQYQAINIIDELSLKYPGMTDLMYRRLFILISAKDSVKTAEVAGELREKFKDDPRHLFELAMAYYKIGNYSEATTTADKLLETFEKTHWAMLTKELKQLMQRNISYNLMSDLATARQKLLRKQEKNGTKP